MTGNGETVIFVFQSFLFTVLSTHQQWCDEAAVKANSGECSQQQQN